MEKPDFIIQTDAANDMILVTPNTDRAFSFAYGSPEGAKVVKRGRFTDAVRFGRSFLFRKSNNQARDITHLIHHQDFTAKYVKLNERAA